MTARHPQAKDIPDDVVLSMLDGTEEWSPWLFMWDLEEVFPDLPRKVILAKMRQLMRRGLVGGCRCGCRGDFYLIRRQARAA